MTDREYKNYLDVIKDFVQINKICPFSAERFADTLINKLLKEEQ